MDNPRPGDVHHLSGDSGGVAGAGVDPLNDPLNDKLILGHHQRPPAFAVVFVGAVLGALIMVVALAVWWRHYQDTESAKTAAAHAEIVLRDCKARADSGTQIQATSMASVAHAEDTARLMGSIRDVLNNTNPTAPAIIAIDNEIDAYVLSVAQFRKVAEEYHPPTVDECVARSISPDNAGG